MAAKGYCTLAQIQARIPTPLTSEQQTSLMAQLEAAEHVIDAETGNPFLTGPILGEQHALHPANALYLTAPPYYGWRYVPGVFFWTYQRPLVSLDAVRGGYWRDPSATTVLQTPLDYRVSSLAQGRFRVAVWRTYEYLEVDYTPVAAVPAEVSEATAQLLAEWAYVPATTAGQVVIIDRFADAEQRYAPPGGLGVAPAGPVGGGGLPPSVMLLLGQWARTRQIRFA